jgi:glycosyltransferase involved in cell wall biosynthesis
MDRPLVSIITALYKEERYFSEAVKSALGQTFRDFELIVSDDGASDEAAALIQRLEDKRISYRRNQITLGSAGNHAAALRAARGKYVAILNHDDLWEPEFLSKLTGPLEADDSLAVAFCDHYVIDGKGKILVEDTEATTRSWKRDRIARGVHQPFDSLLVDQSIPLAMGSVFRKSCLPEKGIPAAAGPAYDLWLTYALCATRLGAFYVPERLSRWRVHPSSQTSRCADGWAEGSAFCWLEIAGDPKLSGLRETARLKAARTFRAASLRKLKYGNPWLAGVYGVKALWNRFAV